MKNLHIFFIVFFSFCCFTAQASEPPALKKALKEFELEHYHNALDYFEEVIEEVQDDAKVWYYLGICHLKTYSYKKAIKYIEKAYEMDPEAIDKRNYHYWYGQALHLNYRFDEAISRYESHLGKIGRLDANYSEIEHLIEQAKTGKKLVQQPKDFVVRNLGPDMNSPYDDHSPVFNESRTIMYFTSKRPSEGHRIQDSEGEYYEKIYKSKHNDGVFGPPELLGGELDSKKGHDACIQLYDNDQKMLVHRNHRHGQILITERQENGDWGEPYLFPEINSFNIESDAYLSKDHSTIFFASNHHNIKGDLNIFYAEKNDEGKWSKPQVIESISTDYDENAPFLSNDESRLYYSSKGTNSMGGYDVFYTDKDEDGNWGPPQNLGHPINSTGHDVFYHLDEETNIAYMASHRSDGYGELDLYAVLPVEKVQLNVTVVNDDGEDIGDKRMTVAIKALPGSFRDHNNTLVLEDENTYTDVVYSESQYELAVTIGADTLAKTIVEVPLETTKGQEMMLAIKVSESKAKDMIADVDETKKDTPSATSKDDTDKKDGMILRDIASKYGLDMQEAYLKANDVLFAFNETNLSNKGKQDLDKVVGILKESPQLRVQIEAHTDNIGSESYNLQLSKERGESVATYLKGKGISADRVSVEFYGKGKSVVSNDSEEGRQRNRRAEIMLLVK